MFIDEKSGIKIHANINETIIHATMRPQDLIPAFLSVIKDTEEYDQIMVGGGGISPLHQALNSDDDEHEYWSSDECAYFLNEDLFEVLNNYAPEGTTFGCSEGNGSDFGFWVDEGYQSGILNIEIELDTKSGIFNNSHLVANFQEIIVIDGDQEQSDIDEEIESKAIEILKSKYNMKFSFCPNKEG